MKTKKNTKKNTFKFPYYNKEVTINATTAKEQLLRILDDLDKTNSTTVGWTLDLSALSDDEYAEFECMMIQVVAERAQRRSRGYAVGMGQATISFT